MKYFTLQWWKDCQDHDWESDEIRVPVEQYHRYYASVKEHLPKKLLVFKQTYSLHDATFLHLTVDVEQRLARLVFLISIRPEGKPIYEKKAVLSYSDVKCFGSSEAAASSLAGPVGHGDLGYDEIEVLEDDLYEHRMLFSSGIEFVVRFSNFNFQIET